MKGYQVMERVGGWVRLWSPGYGHQVWSITKGRIRSPKRCASCDMLLQGLPAYFPISQGGNRDHRLCVGCVDGRPPVK